MQVGLCFRERNFFTGAKPVSLADVSSKNGGDGGGQSAGGN